MNLNNRALGVFIPGQAVPTRQLMTPFGMGDFAPASFPVPFNPIYNAPATSLRGGMGYFMDACFPVPQNPIADAANVIPATAIGGAGMGCVGCGGGCARGGGMGDAGGFFTSLFGGDFSGAAMNNDFVSGVPNIVIVAGVAYFVLSLIGDTKRGTARVRGLPGTVRKHKAAATRARSAYQAALASNE